MFSADFLLAIDRPLTTSCLSPPFICPVSVVGAGRRGLRRGASSHRPPDLPRHAAVSQVMTRWGGGGGGSLGSRGDCVRDDLIFTELGFCMKWEWVQGKDVAAAQGVRALHRTSTAVGCQLRHASCASRRADGARLAIMPRRRLASARCLPMVATARCGGHPRGPRPSPSASGCALCPRRSAVHRWPSPPPSP